MVSRSNFVLDDCILRSAVFKSSSANRAFSWQMNEQKKYLPHPVISPFKLVIGIVPIELHSNQICVGMINVIENTSNVKVRLQT